MDIGSGTAPGERAVDVTADIIVVLAILGVAVVLLVTEWVRYDGVALIVVAALAITGVIPARRTLEGFASPAVITIAAVLILAGGLYRTGVANVVGRRVLRLAGDSPVRVTALTMLTAGILSGVMTVLATTALLLPVVLDVSRSLRQSPSRLLIPLSFGALLGGMTTLVPAPNIILSEVMAANGRPPLHMFDFTPVGGAALLIGILYMVLVGRRLLPDRTMPGAMRATDDVAERYQLAETLFVIRMPPGSGLAGRTLAESRIGRALGLKVLAVRDGTRLVRAPGPEHVLTGGDEIIVQGRRETVRDLGAWHLFPEKDVSLERLDREGYQLAELAVAHGSTLHGHTLGRSDFRNRYRVHAIAVRKGGDPHRIDPDERILESEDRLLVLGRSAELDQLRYASEFSDVASIEPGVAVRSYGLEGRLVEAVVPPGSTLVGRTCESMRLRASFDVTALQIERDGRVILAASDTTLAAGDRLVLETRREDLRVFTALQELEILEQVPAVRDLESERVAFAEVTLAPSASLVGKTLEEVFFRERFGLNLLSIWREGRAYHSNLRLRAMPLRFGDALLVYGDRERIRRLAQAPDFLVLAAELREVFRASRAPLAAAIMAGVIVVAALEVAPLFLAALCGALLMVGTGCVTADEVYSLVQWKVVVLVGGMLALGLAMQESGTSDWIARDVLGRAAAYGPRASIAALFLMAGLAAQFIPTVAVAALMAPIALGAAATLGLSHEALIMVVAVGASSAFLSPFGHAVNLLVMGVGSYRVSDYTRVGAPLFVLVLLVVLFWLPVVWPLAP